jgi:hypothetical protein
MRKCREGFFVKSAQAAEKRRDGESLFVKEIVVTLAPPPIFLSPLAGQDAQKRRTESAG